MTKQCPNCGTEIDNLEKVCSNCGYSFEKEQAKEETTQPKDNSTENTEDTSNFLNKEQNENIEWSELKDMSIGHVMTMFNEQSDEAAQTPTTDSTEPNLTDTAALDQYIHAHKNDTSTEEQTEQDIKSEKEVDSTPPENAEPDKPTVDSETQSESKNEGQEETMPKETNDKSTEEEVLNEEKPSIKEPITKFTKPEEQSTQPAPIGPKALPKNKTEIPSKSKKPEEIEMDAAPIFFKDGEEAEPTKSQFEKPTNTTPVAQESKTDATSSPVPKNYKKMSIVLAAVVVLAGGSWFAYSQTQKSAEPAKNVTQKQEQLATQTEKELNSYFTDDKQVFLKPEMVSVSAQTIKENLETLKEDTSYKKLEAMYQKVTAKQTAITRVNELFAQPIIDGNKLKDVAIKTDKKIDLTKSEEKDDLDALLNQARDQAIGQYDQLQKAKVAIDVFYQNNELTTALTRESYTSAKTEVDKVKSETLRQPLNEILAKADKALNDTANAAQVAAENQAQTQTNDVTATNDQTNNTQTTAGVQPDANTFSAPNADGVYTAPVYSVDANDVSDMSNPAWIWASGVQEKVIATCIERGYITAGAYSLQPARIINGEGYYNLYGADNQYLVTINAKTGWFKGNASRNAGR